MVETLSLAVLGCNLLGAIYLGIRYYQHRRNLKNKDHQALTEREAKNYLLQHFSQQKLPIQLDLAVSIMECTWNPERNVNSNYAQRILEKLLEEATDGYTLMQRTDLDKEKFLPAIKELVLDRNLVSAKGNLTAEDIGADFFYIPPARQAAAQAFVDTDLAVHDKLCPKDWNNFEEL